MESALGRVPLGFLSTGLADSSVVRRAWLVAALSVVVFCGTLPFAAAPLGVFPAFVPVYGSTLFLCDLITAVLLFSQFAVLRTPSLLVLASGYLFTCTATVGYFLVFPGTVSPVGFFGAGPQTTSAMYMFWHAGFPLFVIGYWRLRRRETEGAAEPFSGKPWRAVGGFVLVVLAVVCGFTAFAAAGNQWLPDFLVNNRTTALGHGFLLCIWALNLVALLLLLNNRARTMMDVWLMVVMVVWLCDLGLSAILNTGRYDLGWYVGRLDGLVAAGFLLVLLLIESGHSYSRLFLLSVELEHANTALNRLSLQDALTGLANRRSFDKTLDEQVSRAIRHGRQLALILCDIDHFKNFNDYYGHQAGDEALRVVAEALKSCCRRPGDVAARYGGEEFALILPDTGLDGAKLIAEAAREAVLSQHVEYVGSPSTVVSVSAGIASLSPTRPFSAAELIGAADRALYAAKGSGRNRVELMAD
jgi:diguanylate cyclase (GGDEF)-like protein